MTSDGSAGGPVQASRASRSARRRHGRTALVLLVIVAVVAGGWWFLGRSGDTSGPPKASESGTGTVPSGDAHLMALSVTDAPEPYLAVIGTGPGQTRPAAIPVPSVLTVMVPGQGETPALGVAALPGASLQVALSNLVGTWAQEYAVFTIPQMQAVVERTGGITVNMPSLASTTLGPIGPGTVKVSGAQVAAILNTEGGDSDGRWQAVLSGFLAAAPTLRRADLTSSSSLGGVQDVLDATVAAEVLPMPLDLVAGAAAIPAQPEFDDLLTSTWRTTHPTPVIVQNGSGTPGVGEEVGRRIIPVGFRVVLSQNAQSFDIAHTSIIANGLANVTLARQVRKALGVGLVSASRVPSGIGDITIVVGKDFTA